MSLHINCANQPVEHQCGDEISRVQTIVGHDSHSLEEHNSVPFPSGDDNPQFNWFIPIYIASIGPGGVTDFLSPFTLIASPFEKD